LLTVVQVGRSEVEEAIASNPLFNNQFMSVLQDSLARQGEQSLTTAPPAEPRWVPCSRSRCECASWRSVERLLFFAIAEPLTACACGFLSSPRPVCLLLPPALPRSVSATEEVLTVALQQSKQTLAQLMAWRDQLDRQIAVQQKQVGYLPGLAVAQTCGSCTFDATSACSIALASLARLVSTKPPLPRLFLYVPRLTAWSLR
jgi:hypothetical protein